MSDPTFTTIDPLQWRPPISRYKVAHPRHLPHFGGVGRWAFTWTRYGRKRWWPFVSIVVGPWCYRLGHPFWHWDPLLAVRADAETTS